MDIFNIVVGMFSVIASITAVISLLQSKRAKAKTEEIEQKLVIIEQNILKNSAEGGKIQAGSYIKAGKGIHAHGGKVINKK